jgi:hypothetical protein
MTTSPSRGRLPDRKKDIDPKYPHNQVTVWPGGHELHIDSTKGKERYRFAHKSGTYTEIYHNGDTTQFVVGNAQTVNKGGVTISINNNGDIKIGGHNRFLLGGGAHIEVLGHAGISVGGDVVLGAVGNLNMSVENMYLGVRGNLDLHVAKNTTVMTQGKWDQKTRGNHKQVAGGTSVYKSRGQAQFQSEGTTYIKGSEVRHNSGSDSTVDAGYGSSQSDGTMI